MSLDLGELRANVVIDQGQVPRGLAAVRRKWQDFTRGMTTDAKRAGGDAGGALGNGMGSRLPRGLTAVQRRVEAFWGRLRSGSAKAGEDAGESTSRGMVSRLSGGLRRGVGGLGKVIGGGGSMLGIVALGGAGVLAGLGAAGVAALGAVGVAGAIAGTKVASGNEQAAISFETMLGSATKADRFLRELQKFAAETPFEFPELQSAASSLISAGINADKVIPIMRTLGDVTSGMGTGSEGVKRATIALQQMSAAGRITGEDLNQLRDAGIPVFDLLAKATGKSKEEVVKLAQSGKLGKKELGQMMQALESGKGLERFSGLMEKQSKSLAGMWSTLKDTVGQGLAGIMSNALPIMKEGLEQVSGAAARLFGWFNNNQDSIGRLFKSGQRALSLFGKVVSTVFGAFIKSTGDGTDTVERLANFLDTHQAEMTAVFMALAKFALQGADAMAVLTSATLRGLAFILENVFKVRSSIQELFGGMLEQAAKAFGWVPGLGPKLTAASNLFKEMGQASKDGSKKMADGMRSAADGIDNTLRPGLRAAQRELDKLASTEISKAALRDSATRSKILIASIGTEADGSQVKLKKFADISKLAADRQKALKTRLSDATSGLKSQLTAMEKAGAGQEALTKAWKKGKDRLRDEFKQMGLSNKEAKKLADRYAGVKPKVETKFTTPGLKDASENTLKYQQRQSRIKKNLDTDVDVNFSASGKVGLKAQKNKMSYTAMADGGIMPGYTPGRDVHRFTSPTGGILDLSGGEPVLRPELGTVLGKGWVDGANRAARVGGVQGAKRWLAGAGAERIGLATGGTIPNFDRLNTAHLTVARPAGATVAEAAAARLIAAARAQLKKWAAEGGAPGTGSRRRVRWKGGTFTERFRNTLMAAERLAGRGIPVTQGGFRPKTSYSGTSHAGDAIDTVWNGGILSALRRAGVWAWHRNPSQGPWPHHIHGIPKKGHGWPGGSGRWQQADAERGGNGLASGGFVKLNLAQYDTGGRLRPGWTLAYNGTSKDETVRTHEQEQRLTGRHALIGGNVILQTSDRARDAVGELEFALARIENGGPHE